MAYVTTIERIIDERYQQGYKEGYEEGYKEGYEEGYKEGYEEGYKEGLQLAIEIRVKSRFGNEARVQAMIRHIQRINDLALLRQIVYALETATNLEDIQALYTNNNMPTIPEQPPTA